MSEIAVATWNIRKCVGLDWRRDPHRTAHVIARLDADVVALQEVDKRLGPRPAALTPSILQDETDLEPVPFARNSVSLGWHGNAILVRRGTRVSDPRHIPLPGLEPRGAVAAEVSLNGRRLRIVGVHLALIGRDRHQQIVHIQRELETLPDLPTVILGDFNDWSRSPGSMPLSGFRVYAPGPTFHAKRPVAALDRIAVSREIDLNEGRVVRTPLTRIASDHLPLRAVLS